MMVIRCVVDVGFIQEDEEWLWQWACQHVDPMPYWSMHFLLVSQHPVFSTCNDLHFSGFRDFLAAKMTKHFIQCFLRWQSVYIVTYCVRAVLTFIDLGLGMVFLAKQSLFTVEVLATCRILATVKSFYILTISVCIQLLLFAESFCQIAICTFSVLLSCCFWYPVVDSCVSGAMVERVRALGQHSAIFRQTTAYFQQRRHGSARSFNLTLNFSSMGVIFSPRFCIFWWNFSDKKN